MEKITITNPYGDSLTFEQSKQGYILVSRGDLGSVEVGIETEKGYLQRGVTVTQKSYGSRALPLVLAVKATSVIEMRERMRQVSRLFEGEYHSPDDLTKYSIRFEADGLKPVEVEGHVQTTPSFKNDKSSASKYFQKMFCGFFIPEPFWSDIEETVVSLENQDDLFDFPLDLSSSFEFGDVNDEGVIVNNPGDASAPIVIEFEGLATNPIIYNDTYDEALKLLTTIAAGDVVTINTGYLNPSVTITSGGVTSNAFQYIDPNNADLNMTLRRGNNTIRFTSDDTSQAIASIRFKSKWLTPFSGVDA